MHNRDELARVAADDFGGASLDDTLGRLLTEHWEHMAVQEARAYREEHPEEWAADVAEADAMDRATAPSLLSDPYDGPGDNEPMRVPIPRPGKVKK